MTSLPYPFVHIVHDKAQLHEHPHPHPSRSCSIRWYGVNIGLYLALIPSNDIQPIIFHSPITIASHDHDMTMERFGVSR